jgi:hypothetical protein
MRRGRWIALLAGICVFAPAGAARADLIRLHGTADSAPALDGAQVLVAIDAGRGSKLRAYSANGSSTYLASIPRRYSNAGIAVSAQLLALDGVNVECGECKYQDWSFGADDVLAAAPGRPLQCVASLPGSAAVTPCDGQPACPELAHGAFVTGERLIWRSCREQERPPYHTEIARPLTGAPPEPVPEIDDPQAVAGEWIVGLAPGWRTWEAPGGSPAPVLVERNLLTGQEPLRIPLPAEKHPPSLFDEGEYPAVASVQPDGTVAYVLDAAGGGLLYTASPSQPAPRAVGAWGAATTPSLVRDSASLLLREGVVAGRRHGGVISLERVDGTALAWLQTRGEKGFDFDGTQLAIVETPCAESFVQTWRIGEAVPKPPAGRCPAARFNRVSFTPRTASVSLSCPASPPLGCPWTDLWIEPPVEAKQPEPEGGGPELTAQGFTMLPGTSRTLALALPRGWLRRHRHRHVKVTIETAGATARSSALVRVP